MTQHPGSPPLSRPSPRLREKGVSLQAGCRAEEGVFKAGSSACAKVLRHKAEETGIVCTCDKLLDNVYPLSWKMKGRSQDQRVQGEAPDIREAQAWYLYLLS